MPRKWSFVLQPEWIVVVLEHGEGFSLRISEKPMEKFKYISVTVDNSSYIAEHFCEVDTM